ncbi:MAG: type III-A CRISPR-associated protein Cas10/Csm1, partial [Candidatus Competibacter sp.]
MTSLLRDLGKFAERAGLAMDATLLSELKNDFPPNVIDSGFIAATAPHQQPETALDWVLTIANQAAAGLGDKKIAADQDTAAEQKRLTVRLLTLFEQINARSDKKSASDFLQYRYPLKPMTPASLFPVLADDCEHGDRNRSVKEYFTLWEGFGKGLKSIPASHREALPLWLDHFETLWACYTACIPSTAAPDVSFYDQSKTAAALAVALWRYHHDRGEDEETIRHHLADRATWDEPKFLLVQGDCFGIQEFIFATGGETQKRAAKLLRGRSFYVSLLSECAALKVLEMLDLPPTSQITNAAGKFLIVAPHTPEALERIAEVQKVLDRWAGLLRIASWVSALSTFDKDGDYSVFADRLDEDGLTVEGTNHLRRAAFFERTSNPRDARNELTNFNETLTRGLPGVSALFAEQLQERLKWHHRDNLFANQVDLANFYRKRGDYIRAAIFACEAFITRLIDHEAGEKEDNYKTRKAALSAYTSKKRRQEWQHLCSSYCLLRDLRNTLAHGNE